MKELEVAIAAAKGAGSILRAKLGRIESLQFKGERDPVTDADRASESYIIAAIKDAFPKDEVLSEEEGGRDSAERVAGYPGRVWIIDPLDGTTNFSHGMRLFAISIALRVAGELILGLVYDPCSGELFMAEKGAGAYVLTAEGSSPERLGVSSTNLLERSLLATGFSYRLARTENSNLDHFHNFHLSAQATRRLGSAALGITYVACGRLDGYWEYGLSPWDVAGAALLVMEAGGRITDFHGGRFDPFGPEILASNGIIHDRLLEVLAMGTTGMERRDRGR